jgi:hypothetical protein
MSTDFITEPGIPMRMLRGFDQQGVSTTEETADSLVLIDGTNYLTACSSSEDDAPCFSRNHGGGEPCNILSTVAEHFGVRIISEYEDDWHEIVEKINEGTPQETIDSDKGKS